MTYNKILTIVITRDSKTSYSMSLNNEVDSYYIPMDAWGNKFFAEFFNFFNTNFEWKVYNNGLAVKKNTQKNSLLELKPEHFYNSYSFDKTFIKNKALTFILIQKENSVYTVYDIKKMLHRYKILL